MYQYSVTALVILQNEVLYYTAMRPYEFLDKGVCFKTYTTRPKG